MKSFTTAELRAIVKNLSDTLGPDYKMPQEVAKKYNLVHTPDPVTGIENPGGHAWLCWFIDQLEEGGE